MEEGCACCGGCMGRAVLHRWARFATSLHCGTEMTSSDKPPQPTICRTGGT